MEFRNEFKSSRSGFSHTSGLYDDSELISTAKCNYINRTWESYSFQSSMKQAVHIAIEEEVLRQKAERSIKRLTKVLREDILNSPKILELIALKNTL